jgi:hypothetical protein
MSDDRWRQAAIGGLVGAMAMTGMRTLTGELGLLPEPPPDKVARQGVPALFERVPEDYRRAAIELAHWGFGIAAAVPFAVLPRPLRRARLAGAAYGIGTWALFESVLAPALGIPRDDHPRLGERAALIADHALYGMVVASRDALRSG